MSNEQINLDDPLLTIGEVANLFKVAPYTVREWIKEEKFKATKIGNRWRIPKSEIVKFANEKYGSK